ncbi:MAG: SulP family inorganic anion transporter [Candidatus Nanopelagicaceae bacterium]
MNRLREFLPNRSDYKSAGTTWRKDLIAGITVGIVALPLALAFGITTGAGAAAGLITAILAGLIAAIFGGSNFQVSGPTGAMTVVLVPIVTKYGVESLIPLGFFAGLLTLVLGIFHAGSIINRVPWPVMEGFTLGIAIVIALQQAPTALATPSIDGGRTVATAWRTIRGAIENGLHYSAISIVILALIIKFTYPKLAHKFKIKIHIPASFLAIIISSLVVFIFGIDVPKVGDLPKAIFHMQKFELFGLGTYELITAVIAISALASIESLLSARVADQMAHIHDDEHKYKPNRELFGQGLASMLSSLVGGMPATGAIARTGVNIRSGAISRLSAIFHAGFLLSVVLVLSPIISSIPTSALAGVLLGTSYRMASPANLREILRTTRLDSSILLITALIVIFVDLIWGIAIGTALYYAIKKLKGKKVN